ncbi:hypothetical protein KQH86_07735 [Weissella confusa]|uniref:hypothetical protein n=1 Tax=Weissella confusa TaxID=1583 RepID=UPI001C106ED5|nr:hypothetical protein [Weissella confusa]MBU5285970.1 hypothetical protein [Weissella confusa]MDY2530359.1 hypothetical protein [Weissella confusa]
MHGLLLPLIGLILLSIITFSITLVGKRRRPQLPTARELQQAEAKELHEKFFGVSRRINILVPT